MKFSEKIVRLRKIKGITQDEFASAVGVSRQAVYKWESGQSYPEVSKLLEIKILFNISIDDLLDESYEVAMPEKKKRKRLNKAEKKAVEAEVEKEVKEEPKAEVVTAEPVMAEVKEEPKVEAAPAPAEEKAAPKETVIEAAPEVAEEEKKKGFFGRLFGRK